MAYRPGRWFWLLDALGGGLILQGCRQEEQNRPLTFHKGTNQGQADQRLDEQQVEQLRARAEGQKF
jgi:hypothetical protein